MKQCISELFKSNGKQQKSLHIVNTFKYLLLLISNTINPKISSIWILFPVLVISFASFWDTIMDWGFNRKQIRNHFGSIIYVLCTLNFVLRFFSLSFITDITKISPLVANSLEILRRSLWTHMRITNHTFQQEPL